jgi:lysophospholipase L1-like esterase
MSHVIVCHGNSITRGAFSTYDPIYAYPEQLQKFLASQYPGEYTVFNEGTDGIRTPELTAEFAAAVNVHAGPGENIVVVMEGGNDLKNTPSTVAQALTNMTNYFTAASAAGWTVYACTATPRNEAITTSIAAYNAGLRANPSLYCDALIDVAAASELTNPLNTVYFDADGTHFKNAGFTVIALEVLNGLLPGAKARRAQDLVDYRSFLARLMTGAVSGTTLAITRPVPGGPLQFTLT